MKDAPAENPVDRGEPIFLPAGDSALVVEFGQVIDPDLSARVMGLRSRVLSAIEAGELVGIVELMPSFRSLMVHYDPEFTSAATLKKDLSALIEGRGAVGKAARLWRIPACYHGEFAPDLADVARRTGLESEEVVFKHCAETYRVYMVGFLPGYGYLGDLPSELRLPRKETPRLRVPPGSVAIATAMTAIYPLESPGGWHLIGRSPVKLFDPHWDRPSLLEPGDRVRFQPVSAEEFGDIQQQVSLDEYEPVSEAFVP
ncbi:MAG: 5-oxoprolinase subunit PxpB [Magnetovibrionaceae bacterium]